MSKTKNKTKSYNGYGYMDGSMPYSNQLTHWLSNPQTGDAIASKNLTHSLILLIWGGVRGIPKTGHPKAKSQSICQLEC